MRPELLGDHEYRRDIQEVLAGYFIENWTTALGRGLEWEALKAVIRGENLAKTYGIQKKLDRELVQQQEDTLNALQRQIDNGDALENESRVVHGRIGALLSRLDSYVRKDFRQRLHREGDRSGRLPTWLIRHECSTPIILSLRAQLVIEF
ncbi:hypothetical protein NDU88_001367 [Pleurodeles waltl]|uniref:Uncharacterized protein n=1 Tax=Pleurodeles waltl TaxID=8319 RepID=A0AAV7MJH8_PLEWA|nr:hypothetical protein NDU88_001367 [Pleurodeles waltl]